MKALLIGAFAALAALTLGGCYISKVLLLDSDTAAHPLADGIYERDGGDHDRFRIGLDPDGWYRVEKIDAGGAIGQTRRALFNPLPLDGLKAFAVAEETDDGFVYAVVVVKDERVYLATPDCADPLDASLAVDHGGVEGDDGDMTHACSFRTRDAVLSALTGYAGQADFGAPYIRK
ncbi:MAG: hypothetical protein P4L73_12350 [Caulobacteraceae bacterium]|nr:hypothetical protein [Caulobacteraceae bacterium]